MFAEYPMSRPWFRPAVAFLATAALLAADLAPALAQGRKLAIVRDAEAESLIRDYVRPILKVAGLGGATVQIKIVNDPVFNAFVADGRRIFVNSGTIIDTETPNQLIGVLAHETGHLAGNHLARMREAIARAQLLSAIAMIGGAAAAAAGGMAGVEGAGRGGVAAALGGAQVGQRSILAYQRSEETTADRMAITYLEKTGQSPRGMLETFKRLSDQQLFLSGRDPYTLTHPLAQDRIAQIEEVAARSPFFDVPEDPALQLRHDLVRAKFVAFTRDAGTVGRLYPPGDTSLPALYARAVVTYRYGDPRAAVTAVDGLIAQQPRNPYFWELKGQVLLESGKPAAAIEPLRKAVSLAPKEGLIRVMLGQALVGAGDPKLLKEAVEALTKGLGDDPDQAIGYRQLAIAHAQLGNIPMADLATAQGAFAAGDIKAAKQYAMRAQEKLKRGSPSWLRADDIVSYKPPVY